MDIDSPEEASSQSMPNKEPALLRRIFSGIRNALLREFDAPTQPRYQLMLNALTGAAVPFPTSPDLALF